MPTALVRPVTASYAAAATRAYYAPDEAIDLGRARAQHAAVVQALEALGDRIVWVDAPDAQADAVFVEDTAVVYGGRALRSRSANPARAAEHGPVADALAAEGLEVVPLTAGCLDGGDVLRVGRRVWVGRSTRTDDRGIAGLVAAFPELDVAVVDLPPGSLHLKCVASTPGDGATVVLAEGTVPASAFTGARVVTVPAAEAYAANLVGDGATVVMAAGHPGAAEAVARAGFAVRTVAVDELRKGDGSITCLSLRW